MILFKLYEVFQCTGDSSLCEEQQYLPLPSSGHASLAIPVSPCTPFQRGFIHSTLLLAMSDAGYSRGQPPAELQTRQWPRGLW